MAKKEWVPEVGVEIWVARHDATEAPVGFKAECHLHTVKEADGKSKHSDGDGVPIDQFTPEHIEKLVAQFRAFLQKVNERWDVIMSSNPFEAIAEDMTDDEVLMVIDGGDGSLAIWDDEALPSTVRPATVRALMERAGVDPEKQISSARASARERAQARQSKLHRPGGPNGRGGGSLLH